MKLTLRPYRSEEDAWRIRQFLQQVYLLNQRREFSWQVYRFDYWYWFINPIIQQFRLEESIFLWETSDGELAAVLNPDNRGEACLNLHPAYDTLALQREMFSVAENFLAERRENGSRSLRVWLPSQDASRQALAARLDYVKENFVEYQRRRCLDKPIEDFQPAPGYCVRPLGADDELPARSWLSWRAFHPDEPDEKYEGWDWYRCVQSAPLYRHDLDLVAVAPDGELAAFCTVWYDPVTKTGAFEPVGTHPEHQRKGLGKAVMTEGLRRLARLGAELVTVNSYSVPAGALYASLGFSEYDISEPWAKVW